MSIDVQSLAEAAETLRYAIDGLGWSILMAALILAIGRIVAATMGDAG